MKNITNFGETIDDYKVKVLNERKGRAGAGILFLLALTAFLRAFWLDDFYLMEIFVVILLIDFSIRLLISPKYAPSLILGGLFVVHQEPEYIGASQKRFAWSLGLILSIVLFGTLIIFNLTNFVSLIIGGLFSLLLFLETAFGLCLGCLMYNLFHKGETEPCPKEDY